MDLVDTLEVEFACRSLELGEGAVEMGKSGVEFRRGAEPAATPSEQREPQVIFKPLDPLTRRRWGDAEFLRRVAKRAEPHGELDNLQGLEMSRAGHSHSLRKTFSKSHRNSIVFSARLRDIRLVRKAEKGLHRSKMGQLRRYLVERDIPGIGGMSLIELCGAARASNQAVERLGYRVQWQHSYVADDRTFCIYLADGEDSIRAHAEMSGIPVTAITEIPQIIDPLTANN